MTKKTALTPPELIGFTLLVDQGKRATALATVYEDPTMRIMETDKYYLAQQNVHEAEQALHAYLTLCGVDPELEHVMSDGTIRSSVPGTHEEKVQLARDRQATTGLKHEVVKHPTDTAKPNFPTPTLPDSHASP